VNKITGLLTGALLTASLLGSAALALADEENKPSVGGTAATNVTDRSALLAAQVDDRGSDTTYRFEYGGTNHYGQTTAEGTLVADSAAGARPASASVGGLSASSVYHFRLRATNQHGTTIGHDQTFTTTAPVAATPAGAAPARGEGATVAPTTEAPAPRLGGSVLVAPLHGTVKVKRPGIAGYITLAAGDSVPVGSVLDTRHGTINLTSALGNGKTQSGVFGGALFAVRQGTTGHGMTDLSLRGGNFAACHRTGSRTAAARTVSRAKKSTKPRRRLFGRDKGGRFKTHGHDSVATVRGTSWVTTDTCAGTRTTVKQGSVSVRDRHRRKTVIVRAGHSYLARSRR
jgi:hypothetical protein